MTIIRREIKFNLDEMDYSDLTEEEASDLAAAENAREQSSPAYSNFMVGAAIRTNDDKTVAQGWNVENIIYHALHAEINALGRIPRESRESGLKRVVVVGAPKGLYLPDPVTPCGACRQELLEMVRPEDEPQIIMSGIGLSVRAQIWRCGLKDLLPLAFYPGVIARK